MKKILFVIFCLFFVFYGVAFSADSLSVTRNVNIGSTGSREVDLTLVVDGAAFSEAVPSAVMTSIRGYKICRIRTDPGSTAPTANYDIDLLDDASGDVVGAALDNRSATATEYAIPLVGGIPSCVDAPSALTVSITGNSVADSDLVITLYLVR